MKTYANISGTSGVYAFEYGTDFIRVQFSTGAVYLYNYTITGPNNIEQMKILADNGKGLNKYINTIVKKLYSCKER